MDRTAELFALASSAGVGGNGGGGLHDRHRIGASPFALQSSQLLSKLLSFEHLVEATADAFVDYHRWHPYKHMLCGEASNMTDNDRAEFSQQIALFVTTFATEVRELRRSIAQARQQMGPSAADHRDEVVAHLLDRLGSFTKMSQRMQKEREKYSLNPLALLTSADTLASAPSSSSSSSSGWGRRGQETEFASVFNKLDTGSAGTKAAMAAGAGAANAAATAAATAAAAAAPAPLTQSFVDRYEAEIAPPVRLKEYQAIARKHKEVLLRESKDLQSQYSDDLKQAHKMESTVGHISRLLTEFVQILQTQRDSVDEVHTAGKQATDLVKDTDHELQLTIERSESHSRTMTLLAVGLALLLLLLDWVTP